MDDSAIITQIRAGDVDLYRHIVEKYQKQIRHFVAGKLFDKLNVDDIVQDTFIKFYRALDSFDQTKRVAPYLFAIAHNELKMYYRRIRKDVVRIENLQVEPSAGIDLTANLSEEELTNLLHDLHPDQKSALTLFASGYKYHEIAHILEKPVNTVRTLIRRARLSIIHKKDASI
jgi:RNA polymerase sigma-70 factor (ECF subfamily)